MAKKGKGTSKRGKNIPKTVSTEPKKPVKTGVRRLKPSPASPEQPVSKAPPPFSIELWELVFDFVTSWPCENRHDSTSHRAMAALGLPQVHGPLHEKMIDEFQRVRRDRASIQLVCKYWREIARLYEFRTIWIRKPRDLYHVVARFTGSKRPKPRPDDGPLQKLPREGKGVRRIILDCDVPQLGQEAAAATLRAVVKQCPGLIVVEDNMRRTNLQEAPSLIEIPLQAVNEFPFAIAIGNSKFQSIKYLQLSKDTVQTCTLPWVITLLSRFPNLEILSLREFPGWAKIPKKPEPKAVRSGPLPPPQAGRRQQRSWDNSDEDSDEEGESGADDEEEALQALSFTRLHTFDISRLPTSDPRRSIALSRYLGQWELPSVVNLGLSVYNAHAIPVTLLRQFSNQLETLSLHHWTIPRPKPRVDANGNLEPVLDPLKDKKFDFPNLKHVILVVREVENWTEAFTCPNLTKITMTFVSYQPTPWNLEETGCDWLKGLWESSWKRVNNHLTLCLSKTLFPHLERVHLADCVFRKEELPSSVCAFWRDWEIKLGKRGVNLLDRDRLSWSEAREGMPTVEELQEAENRREEEKAEAASAKRLNHEN